MVMQWRKAALGKSRRRRGVWSVRASVFTFVWRPREALVYLNEPIVPVEGGYLYDFHHPNVRILNVRPPWRTIPCWRTDRRAPAPGATTVKSA